MKQRWWVKLRENGTVAGQICTEPYEDGWLEVDRQGDIDTETIVDGKWVSRDRQALHEAIDRAHMADHGQLSIVLGRIAKELEARCILAGVPIVGRVSREAAIREIEPIELAADIVRHADADDIEVSRIAAKLKIT